MIEPEHPSLSVVRQCELVSISRSSFYYQPAGETAENLGLMRLIDAQEALARFGHPEIFNSDQGSQFTSSAFTGVLQQAGVRVSMDGRGRWMDNVFIERLWRSLKYECIYLHAFETGSELRAGLSRWIGYYNALRPHSTLAGRTPDEAYEAGRMERLAA